MFIGNRLGIALRTVSHAKVAPKGLKPQECERNAGRSKPPIPYIPEEHDLQEAVDSNREHVEIDPAPQSGVASPRMV